MADGYPKVALYLSHDLIDRMDTLAHKLGLSRSHLARKALENYLDEAEQFAADLESPSYRLLVRMLTMGQPRERQELIAAVMEHVRAEKGGPGRQHDPQILLGGA